MEIILTIFSFPFWALGVCMILTGLFGEVTYGKNYLGNKISGTVLFFIGVSILLLAVGMVFLGS